MIATVMIGIFTGFIFLTCLLLVSGGSANVQNIIGSAAGPLLAIFYNATGSKAGSICLLMLVAALTPGPGSFADSGPKVPSRLPALRHYKYHDYKQSHDLCFRQVRQPTTIWRRLAACTDGTAETVDSRRVGSSQKSIRNMRCHSTRSS